MTFCPRLLLSAVLTFRQRWTGFGQRVRLRLTVKHEAEKRGQVGQVPVRRPSLAFSATLWPRCEQAPSTERWTRPGVLGKEWLAATPVRTCKTSRANAGILSDQGALSPSTQPNQQPQHE